MKEINTKMRKFVNTKGLIVLSKPSFSDPTHLVSVIVPSYNHDMFILDALESIACQTFQDFNVYIIDDASTDESVDKILDFIKNHPEISIYLGKHKLNQGAVQTLNHLISITSEKYIALLNSDDIWLPDKLTKQVMFLDRNPDVGAIFTQALMTSDGLEPLPKSKFPFSDVFIQKNRSSGKWLRKLFFDQNCLCHPSILIRKEIYDQIGEYDPRYRQLPDEQMWVRLLKFTKIQIIEKPLVFLRWHNNNTSKINRENTICGINESNNIYLDFFDLIPNDVFVDGFGDLFVHKNASSDYELDCEKAFLYFKIKGSLRSITSQIGIQKLYQLLETPEKRITLQNKYNFWYPDFIKLRSNIFYEDSLIQYVNGLETVEGSKKSTRNMFYLKELLKPIIGKVPFLYKIVSFLWKRIGGS